MAIKVLKLLMKTGMKTQTEIILESIHFVGEKNGAKAALSSGVTLKLSTGVEICEKKFFPPLRAALHCSLECLEKLKHVIDLGRFGFFQKHYKQIDLD